LADPAQLDHGQRFLGKHPELRAAPQLVLG
jgi:hypothetical protein